ncbi:MAG: hypothetical protein ABIA04_12030 [Pseudomonadota bacterium]
MKTAIQTIFYLIYLFLFSASVLVASTFEAGLDSKSQACIERLTLSYLQENAETHWTDIDIYPRGDGFITPLKCETNLENDKMKDISCDFLSTAQIAIINNATGKLEELTIQVNLTETLVTPIMTQPYLVDMKAGDNSELKIYILNSQDVFNFDFLMELVEISKDPSEIFEECLL